VTSASRSHDLIEQVERHGAHNYHPLPVVIEHAQGVWVWDVDGKKYLDMLSSYSALNQGHCHPRIIETLKEQADKVTLTSRAFHNAHLGPFLKHVTELCGLDAGLPMNTGAEAVETAIKAVRKWGYKKKRVPEGKAEIIVCANNFHGRTVTIVSCSTEEQYRDGFGPFTPGFKVIPFGDAAALEAAITPNTVAFLVEPIQAEAGILMPPDGYLKRVREICTRHNVLLVLDEIQTGLGRTGKMFAYEWEGIRPDGLTLGKALGGGVVPVSMFLANREVMDVFTPGDHGSTFGGNPLACAVGRAALAVLIDEQLPERAVRLGAVFQQKLVELKSPHVEEVRGRGLLIGVEIRKSSGKARPYCEALKERGLLCKETHESVIRFAPPLVISESEIDWAVERCAEVLCG
jgi:ornithine--oxo-acid transaminase